MLVITRKAGQRIWIGNDVEVTVGRVLPDGRVRLCITAPKHVTVVRDELLTRTDAAAREERVAR
jgi:carbon storage regulator